MPAALVSSCGIFLIVSALALIVSKSPGAVLVTWHGSAAAYTYYAVLVGTVAFGFWVVPRDLPRWSLTAKVFLPVIR
jgi:glucose dehydrogenase